MKFMSQTEVPGEPVFLLVQDDSSDGWESACVGPVTLEWVRDQLHQALTDEGTRFEYIQAFVMLPDERRVQPCQIIALDGENPGDGPRLGLSNADGVFWSCDL